MIFWTCNRSYNLDSLGNKSSRLTSDQIGQMAPDATITSKKCLFNVGCGLNFWEFDVPAQADKDIILALAGMEDTGNQTATIAKMDAETQQTWVDSSGKIVPENTDQSP